MDWHASGITNDFSYELLDNSLKHVGWLDGVTGGSLTESYRGDYRMTATLALDGEVPAMRGYVRIWHTARLGSESVRTCLATLSPEEPSMEYRLGRWTGSVDLYSGMKRMDTCIRTRDYSLPKNTSIPTFFTSLVKAACAVPYIAPSISATAKTTKAIVLEFGTSMLTNAHVLADSVTGYVGVGRDGRVTLTRYVLPSKRAASWSLESGEASIMLVGLEREPEEMYNRVLARYEADGKTYYSSASLPDAHPWSISSIGQLIGYPMEADMVAAPIQANLDKQAAAELASLTSTRARYEVRCLYDPAIEPGTVGTVRYADSPDDPGLSVRAFCSQRELSLDAGMSMTLTLEELA